MISAMDAAAAPAGWQDAEQGQRRGHQRGRGGREHAPFFPNAEYAIAPGAGNQSSGDARRTVS